MRKILFIVFILIGIADLSAQQSRKILIVSRDSSEYTFHRDSSYDDHNNGRHIAGLPILRAALSANYHGVIDTHFGLLPDSLEKYEAIFTDLRFLKGDDSLIIPKELEKLAGFLQSVGKLYIEINFETITSAYGGYVEYPPFQLLSGVKGYKFYSAFIMGIDSIYGINGYFTGGLQYHRNTNGAEANAPSILAVQGDVRGILKGSGNTLAWQHEKDKQKVVYHWPIVAEHYDEFIGRTVCNYFGLCTPLSNNEKNTPSSFSITSPKYTLENNEISFHYELSAIEPLTVSAFNVLGQRVYYSYNVEVNSTSGELSLRIPSHLVSGGYYLTVSSKEGTKTLPFFVVK